MPELSLLPPELTPELAAVLAGAAMVGDPAILAAGRAERAQARLTCAKLMDGAVAADENALADFDAEAHEQDRFFGVRRVLGPPAPLFLAAVEFTFLDVRTDIEESGTDLTPEELGWLLRGAWTLFGDVDSELPDGLRDAIAVVPACRAAGVACEIRWKLGHRLFFVLTQGIIAALGDLACAVDAEDDTRLARALKACEHLLLASAAALKYTADFPASEYLDRIRPAMMPPHVPPGFSGLDGRDHQVLISLFRDLRPVFAGLEAGHGAAEGFRAAANKMFQAHVLVCDRFGGASHPSLKMSADDPNAKTAAGHVIRKLAAARNRMFQPAS